MTHSWGGNLALFSRQSATIENDDLVLRLLTAPEGTTDNGEEKPYLGAEVRSRDTLTYGRVRTRAKFAKGSSVVSSLVTIYTPWPADNWNELDIEALGKDPTEVQFNNMVYKGPLPATNTPVSPTQDPHLEPLGFDASADFHEYTIEWTPKSATFWVDSELRYTWDADIDLMTLPQNVLLTIWASDSAAWAGAPDEQTTQAAAVYDWVELWTYDAASDTGLDAPGASVPSSTSAADQDVPAAVPSEDNQLGENDASAAEPSAEATAPMQDTPLSGAESQGDDNDEGGASDTSTNDQPSAPSEDGDTENVPEDAGEPAAPQTTPGDPFVLLFRDDFDSLNADHWQLMTHSWDSNLALFSSESVSLQDGSLQLTLLDAPAGTTDDTGAEKSFLGAEVRSNATIEYGRVSARMRLARGSGVVSSLVTIYTPWPADDWNELDIEALGVNTSEVQFNAMVYTGEPPSAPVTTSVSPTQYPQLVSLGFDGSEDYHVYTIEWTPEGASFLVDDVLVHGWSERIDLMGLPQNVLLTIWASASPDWAGPVNTETTGAVASYDWVEVYEYSPSGDD